ncbi:hypothetical protein LCGC14_2415990, partial [marine sediment metagenome]
VKLVNSWKEIEAGRPRRPGIGRGKRLALKPGSHRIRVRVYRSGAARRQQEPPVLSNPVEIEIQGIACAVRPVRPAFTPGEDILLDVLYRNVSDRPITVCVYPDPFWVWTTCEVRNAAGALVLRGPHANGIKPRLKLSHFVKLAPGKVASVRQVIPRSRMGNLGLKPGRHTVRIGLNKINRMTEHILGFDAFCRKHGLKPWTGVIESGTAALQIVPMPDVQWGPRVGDLQCGIAEVDLDGTAAVVPAFLKNVGAGGRKYFDGREFRVAVDGKAYVHRSWAAHNARQFTVYPGQVRGPIRLPLSEYVPARHRADPRAGQRPLTSLAPGKHRLRVTYVGQNGKPRIPTPEVTFTVAGAQPDPAVDNANPSARRKADKDGVKLQLVLDKDEFFLGENVLLHYRISNGGDAPFTIDMGGDGRTPGANRPLRFKVVATDARGKAVEDPFPAPMNMGGHGGPRKLKPGEVFWESLALMRYCDFQKPGTYTVRVYHDLGWDGALSYRNLLKNALPAGPVTAPIAEIRIKLIMPAEAQ